MYLWKSKIFFWEFGKIIILLYKPEIQPKKGGYNKTRGSGRAWRDAACPGMDINLHMPVSTLAQRFGNPDSRKLYADNDLIVRFFHQYGETLTAKA